MARWSVRVGEPAIRLAEPGFVALDTTIGGVLGDAATRAPDAVALVHGVADPAVRRRWTVRIAEMAGRTNRSCSRGTSHHASASPSGHRRRRRHSCSRMVPRVPGSSWCW